jgi:hypothetical protein
MQIGCDWPMPLGTNETSSNLTTSETIVVSSQGTGSVAPLLLSMSVPE